MSQTKPTIKIRRLSFSRPLPDTQPWSTEYLIDELTISLLDIKVNFCMINTYKKRRLISDPKQEEENDRCNTGSGVLRRLYVEQARYKMYRMPIFRPPPVFVVYLKHIDPRIKQELSKLDIWTKDYVMKEVIGRIFEHVDKRFYYLSARPILEWRLE
jgi:hypothetical protein